jgi:hypothetical protein
MFPLSIWKKKKELLETKVELNKKGSVYTSCYDILISKMSWKQYRWIQLKRKHTSFAIQIYLTQKIEPI